ncbi:thiol-disulfide oxidoreductase DCC family protein [Streptomyces sp. NPDC059443]|uniref:thiol-disulfide oxidoreductase DCC family protein n=1 Tax=unclassified Streptomyces TaxID=2593676 RepID=UPI00367D28A6
MATTATAAATATASTTATRHLTVLYDANCPLCVHIRHWLLGQRWLVPLRLIPAASFEAQRRYPRLDHSSTLREITVIGDKGQVWTGTDAFIVCLWALAEHRPKANWLATPAGRPFAKAVMYTAAKWREAVRDGSGDAAAGPGEDPGEPACDDHCSVPR